LAEHHDSAYMNSPTILYCYLNPSSFVLKDIDILNSRFQLKLHRFDVRKRQNLPFAFIKQFFFLIRNTAHSKVIIVQFAGYQSFLPVLWANILKRKSILVLGGTDCVSLPSIQYGNFNSNLLSFFTSYSLRKASLLLPVDETLVFCDYSYQQNDFEHQGYKAFIRKRTAPYSIIYNGFDPNLWIYSLNKSNDFVTIVANLNTRFGYQLKGIDLIFEVADRFPKQQFYIIGGSSLPKRPHPSNIVLLDFMPQKKLSVFLADKRFYLQLSMSEGFPNALCEAMLCGCIPIVSSVGAMPMIVQDNGYVLKKKDPQLLETIISNALSAEDKSERSQRARQKIETEFHISRRRNDLIKIIGSFD
jgi:glycosyltransferase involved in cell wall biosynthesis